VCKSDPKPIRSDPIEFVRISEPKYSFRIGSDWLSCFVAGSDRTSISEIKWINYPRIITRINYLSFIKASSRLSLHYWFDTSIGRHFVSFLTCISCFYIYLVKYFNLNEKFILLKNSSDRIGWDSNSLSKLGSDSD
jgi:hypothetical protein